MTVNNEVEWTYTEFKLNFHVPIELLTLFPKIAPLDTSTVITISGINFTNSETMFCYFDDFITRARFINQSSIECNCSDHGARVQDVSVTTNHQDFSNVIT